MIYDNADVKIQLSLAAYYRLRFSSLLPNIDWENSMSSVCKWNDEKYDKILGEKIIISKEKHDYRNIF